jgi:hypothetical protein
MFIDLIKGAKTFVERAAEHGIKEAFQMTIDEIKGTLNAKLGALKAEASKVFASFKSVLTADDYDFSNILGFIKTAFPALTRLADEVLSPIMPFPLDKIVSGTLGAVGTGILTPILAGMAAVNFGVKKLLAWVIPKLVLGAGEAFNYVNDKLPEGFKDFAEQLSKVMKIGGPGLVAGIFAFTKPEQRERLKAVFLRIANVAGRIQKGVEGAMKAAQASREASFEEAEQALNAAKPGPSKLERDDLLKMIDGLGEFAREQILLALNDPLRRLVTFTLSGLNRLLDVPRNALVAAIGTIPLAGGVLSAALNFGLGLVTDMINRLLTDVAKKLADTVVTDVVSQVQAALKQELLKSEGNAKAAAGFASMVEAIGKLAGEVSQSMQAAATGQQGMFIQILLNVLQGFIQRGVSNSDLRGILTTALTGLSATISKPGFDLKAYSLQQAAVDLLKSVAKPLSQLVARPIENQKLSALVAHGVEALIVESADPTRVQGLMRNPSGFLASLAAGVVRKIKPDLSGFLMGGMKAPEVQKGVEQAIDGLADLVQSEGFSGLLPFAKVLNLAGGALARGFYREFLGKLKSRYVEAKETLQTMLDRVVTFLPQIKAKAQEALDTVEHGAEALAEDAALCEAQITGLNLESMQGLLGCLKTAGLKAVRPVLQRILNEFSRTWRTGCARAIGGLDRFGKIILKAFPRLRTKYDGLVGKLRAKCPAR